jgi:hypothetical protein
LPFADFGVVCDDNDDDDNAVRLQGFTLKIKMLCRDWGEAGRRWGSLDHVDH